MRDWEGHEGGFWDAADIPFLDLSICNVTTSGKKFAELHIYDLGTLFVYVTFKHKIML